MIFDTKKDMTHFAISYQNKKEREEFRKLILKLLLHI